MALPSPATHPSLLPRGAHARHVAPPSQLHHRAVRHARDARRRADKALRLAIDDLRYLFKRLDEPPVDVDTDSFDEVVRRGDVVEAKEWRALEGKDEARRSAWDKFVRRTKVRSACSSLSCSCMRCHERKGATQPTDSPLHPLHLTSLRLLVLPLHSSPRPHHPQEKRAEREAAEQGRTERDRAYERQRDLERATEREREGGAGRSRRASSAADAAEVGRKRPGAEQGEEGADGGERAKRLRLGEEVVVVPEGGGGEGDVTMRVRGALFSRSFRCVFFAARCSLSGDGRRHSPWSERARWRA